MTRRDLDLDDPVFVAQGGFARLRELLRVLARAGVTAQVVQPPGGTNLNA